MSELGRQADRLMSKLDDRKAEHDRVLPYAQRCPDRVPVPDAVVAAKLVKAYTHLMAMCEMPWGELVIASKLDRLEVNGITSPDSDGQGSGKVTSDAVWEQVWQENGMGLESKLAHRAALLDGRAHAIVWPRSRWEDDGEGGVLGADGPLVRIDDCTTTIVEHAEGSRSLRVAALRRWLDEDAGPAAEACTLYRPDGIYKFRTVPLAERDDATSFSANNRRWGMREVDGESWPLPNPLGVVPVVEIAVNRRLAAGRFTECRGEFQDATGLMDRVNLLTFLGLVVAVTMSFPLRVVIGDKILLDDDGTPVPPFEAYVGGAVQFEDPATKLAGYEAADRGQLSIYDELAQLASATSTPRHYFPISGAISNIAAETIRAFESPMHAAVEGSHKPSLSEGHEETMRLGGLMLPDPVRLSRRAALLWAEHESRSLSEKADAFTKLIGAGGAGGLPWQAAAEIALGLGTDQLRRYEAEQAGSALAQIIAAAQSGLDKAPVPAGAVNGGG
jgi:hypothetical protein